jgi:hypothetical protein
MVAPLALLQLVLSGMKLASDIFSDGPDGAIEKLAPTLSDLYGAVKGGADSADPPPPYEKSPRYSAKLGIAVDNRVYNIEQVKFYSDRLDSSVDRFGTRCHQRHYMN